jgi:hypothetical protein
VSDQNLDSPSIVYFATIPTVKLPTLARAGDFRKHESARAMKATFMGASSFSIITLAQLVNLEVIDPIL